MLYEQYFLIHLLFTIIVETCFLFFIIRFLFKINNKKIKSSLLLFAGFISSFLTLPYLWFVLPIFLKSFYSLAVVGEILVVIIEAIMYKFIIRLNLKKAFVVSIACNLASFLLGLLLWFLSIQLMNQFYKHRCTPELCLTAIAF